MQHKATTDLETVAALTAAIEEAVSLLRQGRYSELDAPFHSLRQHAREFEALKQALHNGASPNPGLRESCDRLGKSLYVFSEVARQVTAIEAGIAQLVAGPRGASYDRGGHCDSPNESRFQQEA